MRAADPDQLDQVLLMVDAQKYRQFTALLDAPPAPNLGLQRLMNVRPPWEPGPPETAEPDHVPE